jgi:hypothetical protein
VYIIIVNYFTFFGNFLFEGNCEQMHKKDSNLKTNFESFKINTHQTKKHLDHLNLEIEENIKSSRDRKMQLLKSFDRK